MSEPMPPARRRVIPGMTVAVAEPEVSERRDELESVEASAAVTSVSTPDAGSVPAGPPSPTARPIDVALTDRGDERARRPASDYGSTRLVNFRIPVDLHDRYRRLVREAESAYPRLRRPSLTEVVIALLEEGPGTADEVAELLRRKRIAEHQAEESL